METQERKKTLQDRIHAAQAAAQQEAQKRLSRASRTNPLSLTRAAQTIFRQAPRFTAAIQSLFLKSEDNAQVVITWDYLLAALLFAVIFAIRATNWDFNTLHLDEAIYATVGEDVLSGVYQQGALQWMFGSYLYPAAAALANNLAGLAGLRILSAALSTAAAVFVYLTALRLFNSHAALWALFIFGLTGISINLGQLAVYDMLGVALLALTLYCLVLAVQKPESETPYFEWAGVAFSLSVLAKYIGILLLPALILVVMALHLVYGGRLWAIFAGIPWLSFAAPILIILGIYTALHVDDLQIVLSGQFANQPENRLTIIGSVLEQIGVPLVFALLGTAFGIRRVFAVPNARRRKLVILVLVPVLFAAVLALPLYHVVTANIRSLWKHNVYALVLLAPLAGYGLAAVLQSLRSFVGSHNRLLKVGGAVLTAAAIFWFLTSAVRQNANFRHSWPNSHDVIAYLRLQTITPETRILSSSYAVYEYYFDFGTQDRATWGSVWYTEYGELSGREAIQRAISECAYNVAVIDNYYAPELAYELERQLQQAGYAVSFSDMEQLADGSGIITNVYTLPDGECQSANQ